METIAILSKSHESLNDMLNWFLVMFLFGQRKVILKKAINKNAWIIRNTYSLVKGPHGYKLLKQVDQPLGLQYYSLTMLNNHAEIMIKIQHHCHFVGVFDAANLPNNGEKLIEIHEVCLLGLKSINNSFKFEPPIKREIMPWNTQGPVAQGMVER